MSAPVTIIICADDFGLSTGVNTGIMELVQLGRLSAVSCMPGLPAFSKDGPSLKTLRQKIDIGVHLTLSDQEPVGEMPLFAPDGKFQPFGTVLMRAILGRLPIHEIATEIKRQIDAFIDVFGEPPDFLDGHHHVHQLPGIRAIILAAAVEYGLNKRIYVRACDDRVNIVIKRWVGLGTALSIGVFGGSLRRDARKLGILTNTGFAGAYRYGKGVAYGDVFPRMLHALEPGSIVFCHPGVPDQELHQRDSFVDGRLDELNYLKSDACAKHLEERMISIGRFATAAANAF